MGLRADHVDGREAGVELASIAVDVHEMRGSVAPKAIDHPPKQNKYKDRRRNGCRSNTL